MLWYILIIIGIGLMLYGVLRYNPDRDIWRFSNYRFFLYGGILLSVLSLYSGISITKAPTTIDDYTFSDEPVLRETIEICSFDNNYSVKGNHFLGSGMVSSEDYYYFIRYTDKGKTTDKIPQKETYITEDNSQKPRIEEYAYKGERNAALFWLTLDLGMVEEDFRYKVAYYRVFIPENSLKIGFSNDLN